MVRRLTRDKGLFAGVSSGANVAASLEIAKRLAKGKIMVAVLLSSADRYYCTDLFGDGSE